MKNRAVSLFGVPGKRPPCLHERVFSLLRWVLMRAAGAQPICRAADGFAVSRRGIAGTRQGKPHPMIFAQASDTP